MAIASLEKPKTLPELPDLAAGLNTQQQEAFAHTKGAALVLAGAGSGKTTVLLRRIARLLTEGVPAERLFVTTFTRRAAQEMADRLVALVGEEAVHGLWLGTFHSHCLRILKKEWAEKFGKEGKFDLADENWQKRVCRAILGKPDDYARLPSPPFAQNMRMDPKMALLAVSAAKNQGQTCEAGETALARLYPDWEVPAVEGVARFWRCYEQSKLKEYDVLSKTPSRRLDFDDLLVEAYLLLRDDPQVRRYYQEKFDYVMVDETQDTSAVQWELARLMAARHGNVFIVGDAGQSVYGFRGLRSSPDRDAVHESVSTGRYDPPARELPFPGNDRHRRERTDLALGPGRALSPSDGDDATAGTRSWAGAASGRRR